LNQERAFSWFDRQRSLSKDYDRLTGSSEAFINVVGIYVVGMRLLFVRLSRS
jgi:hypothetical protein